MTNRGPIGSPPSLNNYKVIMVNVTDLLIDRRYQRGVVKTQVKRLVEGWDWDKYHPIVIAARSDGKYAVMAGQQRITAALELKIPRLPAILHVADTLVTEAKSYLGSGEQANIGAGDRFKARIIAGEQKALDIQAAVERAGFSLFVMHETTPSTDLFAIKAVGALESIHNVGYLYRTLNLIKASWGAQPDKNMVNGEILSGTYLALRHLELNGVKDTDIARAFRQVSVKEVIDRGYDRYKSMIAKRSIPNGVASILVERFNYGRREPVPAFDSRAWKKTFQPGHTLGAEFRFRPGQTPHNLGKREVRSGGKRTYTTTESEVDAEFQQLLEVGRKLTGGSE